MAQGAIDQLLDDLEQFRQTSDQRLIALWKSGLLPLEQYELAKTTTDSCLQSLMPAITGDRTQFTTIQSIASQVNRYKTIVNQCLRELYSTTYSSQHLKRCMQNFVQTHISEISARIRAERDSLSFLKDVLPQLDHVKVVKTAIDRLQAKLIKQFESAVRRYGDDQRQALFQQALGQFEGYLCQLLEHYFVRPQQLSLTSNSTPSQTTFTPPSNGSPLVAQLVHQLEQLCREATALTTQLQALTTLSDRLTTQLQALLTEVKSQ
ncbi:MAG: hypothetical protein NZ772_02205 [Cyanobacteria bacterium]|nr:hypothetical protein [Cyanobacteriota bacterium]MDW8199942.1 hypothetical protein [Cyanobacteriota bacterium SKYGB_h_bin112]